MTSDASPATFVFLVPYRRDLVSVPVCADVHLSPRRRDVTLNPVESAQIRFDVIRRKSGRCRNDAEKVATGFSMSARSLFAFSTTAEIFLPVSSDLDVSPAREMACRAMVAP